MIPSKSSPMQVAGSIAGLTSLVISVGLGVEYSNRQLQEKEAADAAMHEKRIDDIAKVYGEALSKITPLDYQMGEISYTVEDGVFADSRDINLNIPTRSFHYNVENLLERKIYTTVNDLNHAVFLGHNSCVLYVSEISTNKDSYSVDVEMRCLAEK